MGVTMNAMLARMVAACLVLSLVGPSAVSATCELTCAMGSDHHSPPTSAEAPCHEHQGSQGVAVNATLACCVTSRVMFHSRSSMPG
jgi:hypothetical protein